MCPLLERGAVIAGQMAFASAAEEAMGYFSGRGRVRCMVSR
jgi:hypothetical protein